MIGSFVRDGVPGAERTWPDFGAEENVLHLGDGHVVHRLDDTGVAAWSAGR
ncbi:hypothetical protein ACLFMI_26460 [Pseudonocardia nantongensis]|uniref:hypothetical protein n=1 Tax=Pseudonocardia nantongensis TaxID=1181885 RepID=UPI003978E3ED